MSLLVSMSCQEKLMKLSTKGKGIAPSKKSNPNYKFYPKNPLPYLHSKPSFPLPYLSFYPFCYIKIKKAPIIHPWAIIHHHPWPSFIIHPSSKAPRKPVTFQNSKCNKCGNHDPPLLDDCLQKQQTLPIRGGGGKGKRGKGKGKRDGFHFKGRSWMINKLF